MDLFWLSHVHLGVNGCHRKVCISNVKNNIDLLGFMGELLRGGICTVFFSVNIPPPFYPHFNPQLCRRCITYKTLKTSHSHLHFSVAKVSHLTLSQAVSGGGGHIYGKNAIF